MAGLLAYSLSERLPVLSPEALAEGDLSEALAEGDPPLISGFRQWQGCSEKYRDHSSGYCPGF
jgi:hypothetical protein